MFFGTERAFSFLNRTATREGNRGRMSKPYPLLTLGRFSRPILACGLYTPSRLGGLASCSPRSIGGRVAHPRVGARWNLSPDRRAGLWWPRFEDCGVYESCRI